MSTNIRVQRICEHCRNEFTAQTTVTRFCSDYCRRRFHKEVIRVKKIAKSNIETQTIINRPIENIKAKEYLTVRDVAALLSCSVRSVYYYIDCGNIEAVNIGKRITRVKRSSIDKLFENPTTEQNEIDEELMQKEYDISECYNIQEVQEKYGFKYVGLNLFIKRNKIPKIRKGWYVYVPKVIIDKIMNSKI